MAQLLIGSFPALSLADTRSEWRNHRATRDKHDDPREDLIPRAESIVYPRSLAELIELCKTRPPDERFKDFRNHVLHVAENGWGGAPQEARRWYSRLSDALHRREWPEAVFAAGVLSHYFSDPFMPLHTARRYQACRPTRRGRTAR